MFSLYIVCVRMHCMHVNLGYDVSTLKPGWVTRVIRVNQVTFCLGHPGQTQFKNYPGLTWIGSCEVQNKESIIWKHNDGFRCNVRFVSHAHFSIQ